MSNKKPTAKPATANKKTVSKNNPNARKKSVEIMYKGQKVLPCKFIDPVKKVIVMGCTYENGNMLLDSEGNMIKYIDVVSLTKK